MFPPIPLGRVGAVFIDDVYFLPSGVTVAPTGPPVISVPSTASPTILPGIPEPTPTSSPVALPTTVSPPPTSYPTYLPTLLPTVESGSSTIAPTSIPPEAVYYDGFEQGSFPDDPEWSTIGIPVVDLVWALTTERAHSGVYSITNPDLSND